ncbi:hypothetical protein MESS4_830018 [Mesorhizobium sp. STM 4661]|nr:hypothetical protein MESS4_830018 [Mesorhizobium sp. STM 4661]
MTVRVLAIRTGVATPRRADQKIEAGKPGPSWSALQASSQGTDRAALTVVVESHAALLSRRLSVETGYT